MTPNTIVLIGAESGPLRSALQALLLSLPQVSTVEVCASEEALLANAALLKPALVVLIDNNRSRWLDLPAQLREQSPESQIVSLVNDGSLTYNTDLILQQGARPEELVSALVSLLENTGD
jgi:DNA-binding NarL/FixJ family response regulator